MKMLEIINVSKSFGGLKALSDVSITIRKGEIYGLIGTNGAGKTTLFNVICNFYKPDSGKIKFKGKDITAIGPVKVCKMGIGRCFQRVKPFRSMTPLENARVARAFGRKSEKDTELSINKIMELAGLSEKKDKITGELTLPDKKNVEIARVLAANPELVLFDEIASGLIGKEIQDRIELIKRLSRMGLTIIIVEHIMYFIKEICDRVGVLHSGKLICEGVPKKVANDEKVLEAYLGRRRR